jgi:hypothetical protein
VREVVDVCIGTLVFLSNVQQISSPSSSCHLIISLLPIKPIQGEPTPERRSPSSSPSSSPWLHPGIQLVLKVAQCGFAHGTSQSVLTPIIHPLRGERKPQKDGVRIIQLQRLWVIQIECTHSFSSLIYNLNSTQTQPKLLIANCTHTYRLCGYTSLYWG